MEIFRIRLNSNDFQCFLPTDNAVWKNDILKMDCSPKLTKWRAPEVYIQNPKRQKCNFSHLCSGAFVIDQMATKRLRSILEMAGELLPLEYKGFPYYLLNVLECVNCLDSHTTEWVIGKNTGAKIRISKYCFDKRRLSESTLFKIPETAASEVLCVSGIKDPEDEFKAQVEASGFRGLLFEKLWSDQD